MFARSVLQTTKRSVRFNSTVAAPRPRGGFKGLLTGFLLGTTITGFGAYYYLLDEYKSASNAVVSDVLVLQKSIRKLEGHVRALEETAEKK
ncbi:hypothetical protein B5S28_g1280 [[Candida] boidinii]|uniref:Unnamed protein product n=1 Tax=Candida boidinii TaxID=5477 RepID=A0ACB5TR37_CANBO|nr:hypothetical protein B5S28_g1280 [[Candida] boidinii]OWB60739.1 hypothetical protein B5S29_g1620 [[Candida] boidinii]OWB76762.1 hypothetical protein B5S32_g917 [[Candida] boidinii]GME93358.1 unnamed protein product [[Candida] boidinii]GME97608.1 unnamed protein product [[Candida] boidinii]